MARIAGVDLPNDKFISIALTSIYGVGRVTATRLCHRTQIDPHTRTKELTEEEVTRLTAAIQQDVRVEGDLRREVLQNIKRLMDIDSYRGTRHKRGLPVRGQRTHTNARSRKGPRRVVGAKRSKA